MTKLSILSSDLWGKWRYQETQISVHIMAVVKVPSLSRCPLPHSTFLLRREYQNRPIHSRPWRHRPVGENIVNTTILSSVLIFTFSPVSVVYRLHPWWALAVLSDGKSSIQPLSLYRETLDIGSPSSRPPVMTTLVVSEILQAEL